MGGRTAHAPLEPAVPRRRAATVSDRERDEFPARAEAAGPAKKNHWNRDEGRRATSAPLPAAGDPS